MPQRIDVLEGYPPRSGSFRGRILDADNDPELDRITREAALELRAPTCVVSLILDRTQYSRASYGLPETPANSRTISRDLTLCQYVVHERSIVAVSNVRTDERVPQEILRQVDVGSYLGAPLLVTGEVVGALCIIDTRPREFAEADRATLARYATQASARLAELAAEQRGTAGAETLLRAATRPVFQDLRNAIWQLSMTLEEIQTASSAAQPLVALAKPRAEVARGTAAVDPQRVSGPGVPPAAASPKSLDAAAAAVADLMTLTNDALKSAKRLEVGMYALEAVAQHKGESADLAVVVRSAANLAEHFLKLIGGFDWRDVPSALIQATPAAALVQIATALSLFAEALNKARGKGPLKAMVEQSDDRVTLLIKSPVDFHGVAECVFELQRLLGPASGVSVSCADATLCLGYRALQSSREP
jgi:hypothetical protein